MDAFKTRRNSNTVREVYQLLDQTVCLYSVEIQITVQLVE